MIQTIESLSGFGLTLYITKEFQNRFYHIIVDYIISQPMSTDKRHLVSIVFVILCFTAYYVIIGTKQAVCDIPQTAGGSFICTNYAEKGYKKKRDKQIILLISLIIKFIDVYMLINTRPR